MNTKPLNTESKEAAKVELPKYFESKISQSLLHEVARAYMANQRSGTHSTKTRSEVHGGGKKPWRQKGTGRARAGTIRSPLWCKGGITFGPKPRDYYQNLPVKKKRLALQMSLTSKVNDGSLILIDEIKINEPKTKKMVEILEKLKINEQKVIFVTNKIEKNLKLASRNIPNLIIDEPRNLNAYKVLWANKVVFTPEAIKYFDNI